MTKLQRKQNKKRILVRIMMLLGPFILLILLIFVVRAGRVLFEAGWYRAYWEQQTKQPVLADSLQYVALGDSVAQGVGASKPQNSYVGRLVTSLEEATGRPVQITNLSVSGARTQDVIRDQLPKLKRLKLPKDSIVTIDIGANNMGPNFNPTTFEQDMSEILQALPPQTVVADIPYFGGGIKRTLEPHVVEANKIIGKLTTLHGLRRAPVYESTKHSSLRDVSGDFFHPSDHGYNQWYDAFWSVLKTKN